MSDWTGNKNSIYKPLGASNHTIAQREEHDFYATDPAAVDKLLEVEKLETMLWEPACGAGHISRRLIEHGYHVDSTDLIYRDFGRGGVNFLECETRYPGSIITNPPYKYVTEFVLKSLELISPGHKVVMLLKLTALEGQDRYNRIYSRFPPKKVYVFSKRISCGKNGEFNSLSSAVAYAWFVWEKGYSGDTFIKWI